MLYLKNIVFGGYCIISFYKKIVISSILLFILFSCSEKERIEIGMPKEKLKYKLEPTKKDILVNIFFCWL